MDSSASAHPPVSFSTTENPVAAVGRKVKAVLSTYQQPSVRIIGETSNRGPARVHASEDVPAKVRSQSSPHGHTHQPPRHANFVKQSVDHANGYSAAATQNAHVNRFANTRSRFGNTIGSIFGRQEKSHENKSYEHEYDQDTVDLLDVMGT
jgi:hypothetical protein